MDRYCFDGSDSQCSFDFAEASQLELVDLRQLFWVLPVVLNHVDIVGDSQ